MRVQLHPEAEEELYRAAAWYDDVRLGLGDEFLDEMTRWLAVLAEAPTAWPAWPNAPEVSPPIRKLVTDRFPYAVAYQASSDLLRVLAFAHTSRRPFYWASRLESRAE